MGQVLDFMALETILSYFKNVQNLLKNISFEGQEESAIEKREIILKNAFAEIDGYEYRLCCHHDGSLLTEELLSSASNLQLRIFLNRLVGSFVKLITNRYASHVIETALITLITRESSNPVVEGSESDLIPGTQDLIKIFLLEIGTQPQLEDLLYDTFASKVLRKVILPLSISFPDLLLDGFRDSFKQLSFEQLAMDSCGALVLQDFISCGIEINHDGCDLLVLSSDKNASRVVEALIIKYGSESFWKKHFRGKLRDLLNKNSNFVLQKLISESKNIKTIRSMIDELKEYTDLLLSFPGALFKLCQKVTISEFDCCQKRLKENVLDPLFPDTDLSNIISLKSDSPKPLGCQIASCLLDFKDNNRIVDQIFSLSNDSFIKLSTNKFSSRLLEKFFVRNESPVSKFVKKMERKMTQLACDSNASHLLEQIFSLANTDSKLLIANELVPKKKALSENKYGSIVWNNLRMEEFIHNRERWINYGEHLQKRKLLFEDLFHNANEIPIQTKKKVKSK